VPESPPAGPAGRHCRRDDDVAGHEVEPRAERSLVPEVPRQGDDHQARVVSCGFLDQGQRAVPAAIVDQHDLVRAAGDAIEDGAQAPEQLADALLLVMQGNRDRDARPGAHRRARPLK
jgi:hypothetical protein